MDKDSYPGRNSFKRRRTGPTRLMGVIAVIATLAMTGAGFAGADPSNAPTPTEDVVVPSEGVVVPSSSSEMPLTTSPVPSVASEVSPAPPAPEARTGFVALRSRATGACLDDSSFGLRGFGCNGLDFQRWNVIFTGDAYYRIQNMATGRCLDDSSYGFRTVDCNGGQWQLWSIIKQGSNGSEIKNRFGTTRCVDDSNLGVRTLPCNGTVYQRWDLN